MNINHILDAEQKIKYSDLIDIEVLNFMVKCAKDQLLGRVVSTKDAHLFIEKCISNHNIKTTKMKKQTSLLDATIITIAILLGIAYLAATIYSLFTYTL